MEPVDGLVFAFSVGAISPEQMTWFPVETYVLPEMNTNRGTQRGGQACDTGPERA